MRRTSEHGMFSSSPLGGCVTTDDRFEQQGMDNEFFDTPIESQCLWTAFTVRLPYPFGWKTASWTDYADTGTRTSPSFSITFPTPRIVIIRTRLKHVASNELSAATPLRPRSRKAFASRFLLMCPNGCSTRFFRLAYNSGEAAYCDSSFSFSSSRGRRIIFRPFLDVVH
jgi:hypothetical protein